MPISHATPPSAEIEGINRIRHTRRAAQPAADARDIAATPTSQPAAAANAIIEIIYYADRQMR